MKLAGEIVNRKTDSSMTFSVNESVYIVCLKRKICSSQQEIFYTFLPTLLGKWKSPSISHNKVCD